MPIKVAFPDEPAAESTFEGQTTLKLGTHCRADRDADQYVMREYLSYKLANLVTPLSFRARLARGTYVDAKSKKKLSTHSALFLEHENDVARRLGGRDVKQPHMAFSEFDKDALTTTMMLEVHARQHRLFDLDAPQHRRRPGQAAQVLSRCRTISICRAWCIRRTPRRIRGCR